MNNLSLDSLIVNLSGARQADKMAQANEDLRLAKLIEEQLPNLLAKCGTISYFKGNPSEIKVLEITGERQIDFIEVTYLSQGQIVQERYTPEQFYSL